MAVTESGGAYATLLTRPPAYRVPSPFQVMLYRVCPSALSRLDAIMLAVHPVEEHLCRAQPLLYLLPVRADAASMAYRRWLRGKNLTFGVLP